MQSEHNTQLQIEVEEKSQTKLHSTYLPKRPGFEAHHDSSL